MFPLNKFFLIGGGLTVAGTGTGLGVYYGINGGNEQKASNLGSTKKPDESGRQVPESEVEDDRGKDDDEAEGPSIQLPSK